MEISYDPVKREATLRERGLDFADCAWVFNGPSFTFEDTRMLYPEPRYATYGLLGDRMIAIVWTPTQDGIRIISMRKANEREQARNRSRLA